MKHFTVGTIVTVGLLFTCTAFAVGAANTTDFSVSTIVVMSVCLAGAMGLTFLVTMGLSSRMYSTGPTKTSVMHQQKLLRHEVNTLRKELSQRERVIEQQESRIRQLQSHLSFAGDPPVTAQSISQPRSTGTLSSPKIKPSFPYGGPENDQRRKRGTFPTIKLD